MSIKLRKTIVAAVAVVSSVAMVAPSFAGAVSVSDLLAQIAQLQAQLQAMQGGSASASVPAACVGVTFTRTLKVGSVGNDVKCLQAILNATGHAVAVSGTGSVGMETTFFGPKTLVAVRAFQSAKGWTPANQVGPMTMAALNAWLTAGGSTGTGTGTGTGTTGLNGTAGSITVTQTATDVETNVQTGMTDKVVGFKVEATGSDVRVSNVRVKFTYTGNTTGSDRISNYAQTISIWQDGVKVGEMSAADFTRDSAGVYSGSIPVSAVVRMGSGNKSTFHVGFTANTVMDSDDASGNNPNAWTVDVVNVRYNDASGAILTESNFNVEKTDIQVERLSDSSDVKLNMTAGSGNPTAMNIKVDENSSQDVKLAEFTLTAQNSPMTFDKLQMTLDSSTSNIKLIATDVFLEQGSNKIAEQDVSGVAATTDTFTFSLDDLQSLAANQSQTYSIVARVQGHTTGGYNNGDYLIATNIPVSGINAKASDGKTVSNTSGSVTTYRQTLYVDGINAVLDSSSAVEVPNSVDTTKNYGLFTMNIKVTNFGSTDVYVPLAAVSGTSAGAGLNEGAVFAIENASLTAQTYDSATLAIVSGGTQGTNSVKLSSGQTATLKLTVNFTPSTSGTVQYRMFLRSIGWATTDSATSTSYTSTLPVENYRTVFVPITH